MAGKLTGAKPSLRSRNNKKSIQEGFDQAQKNTQSRWSRFKQNALVQGVANKFKHAGQDIAAGYRAFRDNRKDRHAVNDWSSNVDYFQSSGVDFQIQADGSFRMVGTSDRGRSLIERIMAYQAENAKRIVQTQEETHKFEEAQPNSDEAKPSGKESPAEEKGKGVQSEGKPAAETKPEPLSGKQSQAESETKPETEKEAPGKKGGKKGRKGFGKGKDKVAAAESQSDEPYPNGVEPQPEYETKPEPPKKDAAGVGNGTKNTIGFFTQAMQQLANNGQEGMDAFVYTLMEGCKQYLAMSEEDKSKNFNGFSDMVQGAGKALADRRAAEVASEVGDFVAEETEAERAAKNRWTFDDQEDGPSV